MLETFFDWAGNSALGDLMRNSRYAYPLVEMVHLLGLAVVLGSLLLQCSRLLGFGMRRETFAEVTEDLGPWTSRGLVMMFLSGALMFASRAPDLYDYRLQPYLTKLGLIGVGLTIYYFVQRRYAQSFGSNPGSNPGTAPASNRVMGGLIGLATLTAFFGAAIAALWVEFL